MLSGVIVSTNCKLSPSFNDAVVLLREISYFSVSSFWSITVTIHWAVLPFLVVTFIIVSPTEIALIFPFWSTVATFSLELSQTTLLSVALSGATSAISV